MPALVGPARSALLLLAAAVAALAGLRYAALHLPSLPSLLPGASPAAHRRHGAGMAPAAVVVVGGGLAGASAALAAAEAVPSARVVLLEKEPRPGGNSMKASSGMNALDWLAQQGVELTSTVQLGGHSRARTHANTAGPNVGYAIMRALLDRLEKAPNVEVVSSAKVGGWVGGVGGWAVAVGVGGWVCGWV